MTYSASQFKVGQHVQTSGAHLLSVDRGVVCRWHRSWGERLDGYVPVNFPSVIRGCSGIMLVPVEQLVAVSALCVQQ